VADYFETEEVVKEFDSKISGRILSYLKPYKLLAAVVLITLAFSTVGELLIPVLQQRLIDRSIMSRFLRIDRGLAGRGREALSPAAQKALDDLLENSGVIEEGEFSFVPQDQRVRLSGAAEEELRGAGLLSGETWYVSKSAGGVRSLTIKEMDTLSAEEKRMLRQGDLANITRTVIVILGILLGVFFFTFIETWTSVLIGQRVMKDIRLQLFKKTLGQSTAFLSRHPVGRIVTRLTSDVETINQFFTDVLIAFLKDFSVMAGALLTLFILSPRLAAVTLVTLPPVLLVTGFSRVRARDAFRKQRVASSRVNSYLSERLSGVQVVQLFLGEKRSQRDFGQRNGEFLKANLAEMFVYAIFRPIIDFLSALTTATVIAVGANLVLGLSLSLGVLIAFINLVALFYSPVMDIAEKYTLLQSAMAGGERVFALLDTDEKIPDEGGRHIENLFKGRIVFKNVSFAYKEGEEVLKNISFTVEPGQMAAIVGYTGAGKTTITNVLTRLWDIQGGSITLDGIPIADIPLAELRRAVLPVLQEVFLFSGTVAENIALGLPLSEEEIVEAAKAVHAHEFISKLPDGYKTTLSEGAANISSGQRQLLSFARVIAHNPAMVILDEATSSVDTETERLIQLGIQRVLAGRTSIVIAHRLSTIRNADRILVLSGGRLVEEGGAVLGAPKGAAHDALIAKNGLYAGLYRLQFMESSGGESENPSV
jgi:ATP-binding cassette subfamily B protein